MVDIFIAGMETTATSLILIILQLIHHPEVQEKLQEEIEKVNNGRIFLLKSNTSI
jgi:cytochrome P450